jgi:uncharacterized protein YprB with RNaseH-like and TPR domain
VLSQTFVHLPGVGAVTERAIWEMGILDWSDFAGASSLPLRASGRQPELARYLEVCRTRLDDLDGGFFDSCLPSGEQWRTYADFRHRAAFLDIETTGLSPMHSYVTMVGILDSDGYKSYVRDENLEDLREALERYTLIVTFNGASFDLPFLEYHFGRLFGHVAHFDLRYPLRRLGYRGGLKAIEADLEAGRPSELAGLSGFDAVRMWSLWRGGDSGALETLIRYNAEDVASLPSLAESAYNGLLARLPLSRPPIDPWSRPDIDLPYDRDLIERLTAPSPAPYRTMGAR